MTNSSSDPINLNLNDLAAGRVELASFQEKVHALDPSPYKDRHVQLRGCAPTWAHLMVAGKLFPTAAQIDFVIDDGKAGKPVLIYKR